MGKIKKSIASGLAGVFLVLGVSACTDNATSEPVADPNAPVEELISARVVNKRTVHRTYGYPPIMHTDYYFDVSYDDQNIHIGEWEVSKFTYDACILGYTATKYSNDVTTCLPPVEESGASDNGGDENSETSVVEDSTEIEQE